MSETSEEKCPKCGAKRDHDWKEFRQFECGSQANLDGGDFGQSATCEKREIASLRSSVAALTEKLEAASRERAGLAMAANRARRAGQILVEAIGSIGPEGADDTAKRAVVALAAANQEIGRLRAGIEAAADDCRCRAGNWNAEAGIELAAVAQSLAALLAQSEAKEGSDGN